MPHFGFFLILLFFGTAALFFLVYKARAGSLPDQVTPQDYQVRGSRLLDLSTPQAQAILQEKRSRAPLALTLGGVPLDAEDEQQGILICGAPGTGKSVEIKKSLRTIRARQQKAIVYDPTGEFTSMYFRPDCDVILNPLDQRGAIWNPWMDSDTHEFPALAKSFIPDPSGDADPFWTASARAIFEALLMQCDSLDELIWTALSAPQEDLLQTVQDAGMGGMAGPAKTFQSSRSTLATYIRSLAMLPNVQRVDASAFSFRQWLTQENDSWVFLSAPAGGRDATRPLISMLLDTAIRHVMTLRPDPDRRIWLELDELPSLQNIPALHAAMAECRKYGLIGILGVQTIAQLQKIYGKEAAAALWGLPKTRLYLRIADADTAEQVSKELGEKQVMRITRSASPNRNQHGIVMNYNVTENQQFVTEHAVIPAEIMGLPDLQGFLRTGGSSNIAKVLIGFDGLPRTGNQPDFIQKPQRLMPKRPAKTQKQTQETPEKEPRPSSGATDDDDDGGRKAFIDAHIREILDEQIRRMPTLPETEAEKSALLVLAEAIASRMFDQRQQTTEDVTEKADISWL